MIPLPPVDPDDFARGRNILEQGIWKKWRQGDGTLSDKADTAKRLLLNAYIKLAYESSTPSEVAKKLLDRTDDALERVDHTISFNENWDRYLVYICAAI
jgi:hypothetical protein